MTNPKHPVFAGSRGSNYQNRAPSTSSPAPDAALTGAAKAFINSLPPDELVKFVNRHSPKSVASQSRRLSSDSLRSSYSHKQDASPALDNRRPSAFGHLNSHEPRRRPRPSDASTSSAIAASVAASRATRNVSSVSPPAVRRRRNITPPRPSVRTRAGSSATSASVERLDESSIPATTSLVKLFEQKHAPTSPSPDTRPTVASKPVTVPSKPVVAARSAESPNSASASASASNLSNTHKHDVPFKPAELQAPANPPVISSKPVELQSPKPLRRSLILDEPPPPLFASNPTLSLHTDRLPFRDISNDTGLTRAPNDSDDSASVDSFSSAKEILSPIKTSKPPLPPARRSVKQSVGLAQNRAPSPDIRPRSQNHDMSSATPNNPRRPSSAHIPGSSAAPNLHPSIAAAFHQMHPRRITPLTTGDSLADAYVASSLASSRAASPPKGSAAPPVHRHKLGSVSHSLFARTPSPAKKGMRHTLRKSSASSSEEEKDVYAKHKKKKYIKKHPNKHHEGDRKRWRDAITERERKRYEGLWAANKGIHSFYTPEEQEYLARNGNGPAANRLRDAVADQVTDIVTRDIWRRSRLGMDILEHVWNLVDSQAVGRLLKEEFVVGLWLIDQCLKGRKLPTKVTESVWGSVRLLMGIKVRRK